MSAASTVLIRWLALVLTGLPVMLGCVRPDNQMKATTSSITRSVVRPTGPEGPRGVSAVEIAVPNAILDDLRVRIAATRWPQSITDAGWDYGADLTYMKELAKAWEDAFDWRAEERRINRFAHYRVELEGLNVHFIHARSKKSDAIPLLVLHGWPSSFLQMLDLIPKLTEPDSGPAFHVVAASLPGYGLSDPPTERGMSVSKVARMMTELMVERLGYERFGGRGSDLGAGVLQQVALQSPSRLIGLHLSGTNPYVYDVPDDLSDEEKVFVQRAQAWMQQEMAYAMMHSSKPQTVAFALNDSPVGMAAWIMEKFWRWSDSRRDMKAQYGQNALLANLTLYWVTESMPSSMRLYYETVRDPGAFGRVTTPTAMLMTPKDMFATPRAWAARSYNVVRWTELESGGHFLEWDETDAVAKDLQSFFQTDVDPNPPRNEEEER